MFELWEVESVFHIRHRKVIEKLICITLLFQHLLTENQALRETIGEVQNMLSSLDSSMNSEVGRVICWSAGKLEIMKTKVIIFRKMGEGDIIKTRKSQSVIFYFVLFLQLADYMVILYLYGDCLTLKSQLWINRRLKRKSIEWTRGKIQN